jgi:hypothetical protein
MGKSKTTTPQEYHNCKQDCHACSIHYAGNSLAHTLDKVTTCDRMGEVSCEACPNMYFVREFGSTIIRRAQISHASDCHEQRRGGDD